MTTTLTVVVDASVLVGALVPHDPHYIASRRWLNRWSADGTRLCAPVLILAEVVGAVARRTGDPARGNRALGRIQRIPRLRLVLPDEKWGIDAANIAATLSLRGADAV